MIDVEGRKLIVDAGERELPVGPGDFVGFPPNGPAHLVRNTSDTDLVYLQGGDRRPGDQGRFPELRKLVFQHDESHLAMIDEARVEIRPFSDWIVKD